MKVDLRYNGISIEQLFSDWGVEGHRPARRGDRATSRIAGTRTRCSKARARAPRSWRRTRSRSPTRSYPIPLAGSTDFSLDNGVVTFRNAELDTDASHISLDRLAEDRRRRHRSAR